MPLILFHLHPQVLFASVLPHFEKRKYPAKICPSIFISSRIPQPSGSVPTKRLALNKRHLSNAASVLPFVHLIQTKFT